MLISYQHKFIFLHNRKCAGTSIKAALRNYGLKSPSNFDSLNKLSELTRYSGLINSKISNAFDFIPNYREHITAQELKEKLPESIWSSYFKFCFVRNPWDIQVSLYFFMLKRKDHYQHEIIKNLGSFEEYIKWISKRSPLLQKEYACDQNNKVIVDYVGRFEDLNNDFSQITNRLGIDVELPHENQSLHTNYQEYYDPTTRRLVAEIFSEDINFFGYKF